MFRPTLANGCRRWGMSDRRRNRPTAPVTRCQTRKTRNEILERYRAAVDLASERRWADAITELQRILRDEPEMADVWSQLAALAVHDDRFDVAIDAYKHFIELKPSEPLGYIGAAATLLRVRRLDDAREHAQLAIDVAPEGDARSRASAHELLAKIALARHDVDGARAEAELARQADPTLPIPTFIEARVLYDQGQYAEALPLFQQAIADLKKSGTLQITELHFYTGGHARAARTLSRSRKGVPRRAALLPAEHARARGPRDGVSGDRPAGPGRPGDRRHAARDADAGRVRACREALVDVRQPTAGQCRPRGSAARVRRTRPVRHARHAQLNRRSAGAADGRLRPGPRQLPWSRQAPSTASVGHPPSISGRFPGRTSCS